MSYFYKKPNKLDFQGLPGDDGLSDRRLTRKHDVTFRDALVASLGESVRAISSAHDQQYGSILSSVGPSILANSTSSDGKQLAPVVGTKKISSFQRKTYLAIFLCLYFIGAALFSIPAPFFPTRAMEKGVSQTMAGIILGSMQLVQFVVAIIFAVTMFHFGLKFMLCYGIFWAASCSFLFGLLDLGPNDGSYQHLCFAVRLIQGIGISAYYISASTIAAVLFSDNLAFTIGILQTCYSLGCLAGPSIGGALYSAGGYICPFAVMGGILMIYAPLIAYILPSNVVSSEAAAKGHENPAHVFKSMLTPALFCLFYTMLVGTMTTVFTETTLGVRLAHFGVEDPLLVGCVYLSSSGAYGLTAPIAGRLTDKLDGGWGVMFFGTCMSIVGYLIIGPSPILQQFIEPGLTQLIIGSCIAHCGIACCLVPMTRELQRVAMANGLNKDDPATLSFISAFFDSCWGLGGFLGAFLAGFLMENFGYPFATTIQALVLVPSIPMQIFLVATFRHLSKCVPRHQGYTEI